MGNTLVIWDQKELPKILPKDSLLWQSYDSGENFLSVPNYLEKHAVRLRLKYLRFVHDLGRHRIKGKRIVDHLDIGEGFSFWWMTLIAEKSPFKSTGIYDCLRLLALEEILKEKSFPEVKLFSGNKNLGLAIQKLCGNLQINFSWGEFTKEQNNVLSVRKIFFSFPNVIQALIKFFWEVKSKWPLQKQGKSAWHTGGCVFFFVLILFTWT